MTRSPLAVFRRLTTGVYVIGAAHGGRTSAFTAAWLTQVAFEPLLVALSVNTSNASFPLLKESGGFVVNVLHEGQLDLARHFGTQSGHEVDKLHDVRWRAGQFGAPVLSAAAAFLECRVTALHSAGDHVIVIAEVVDGAVLAENARPMRYDDTGNMDGSETLYPASF
jgi:flavin reductase (DIM6/NTAB) family NADH-FMN oxidoreductase RutF